MFTGNGHSSQRGVAAVPGVVVCGLPMRSRLHSYWGEQSHASDVGVLGELRGDPDDVGDRCGSRFVASPGKISF